MHWRIKHAVVNEVSEAEETAKKAVEEMAKDTAVFLLPCYLENFVRPLYFFHRPVRSACFILIIHSNII